MTIEIWLFIVLLLLTALAGGGIGFYISQRVTKKYLKENPPVSEKMIRMMFQQMGRKPSEKQIREIMRSMSIE
jgi:uncharacterized protein YneF (UPF0154 family)